MLIKAVGLLLLDRGGVTGCLCVKTRRQRGGEGAVGHSVAVERLSPALVMGQLWGKRVRSDVESGQKSGRERAERAWAETPAACD